MTSSRRHGSVVEMYANQLSLVSDHTDDNKPCDAHRHILTVEYDLGNKKNVKIWEILAHQNM